VQEEAQEKLERWTGRTGVGGQTLYQALDAFADYIRKTKVADGRTTPYGKKVTEELASLKQHARDVPLTLFGLNEIEEIITHWKHRPQTKKGKPCAIETARHMIKRLRKFIKWLHKEPSWHWRKPADYEPEQVRIPRTAEEKTRVVTGHQVQTYTVDELATLYQYATPRERVLMLLALNCGFGRAELVGLQKNCIFLDEESHPVYYTRGNHIRLVRPKTGVFGDWQLWGETVAGIKWYLSQRPQSASGALLVTKEGKPLAEQTKGNNRNNKIPAMWSRLQDRVSKDHPQFAAKSGNRRLSFNKLRKTGINLIRKAADGEIAGIFACHGTPVKSDNLLDLYTNRPFDKVFVAINVVRAMLEPMFSKVPNPFPAGKASRPSIGLAKLERIPELRRQGLTPTQIAEQLGISRGL
jgi:site-specific recombinase XerC